MIAIDRSGSPDRPVKYDGFEGLSWISRSELSWLIDRLPEHGTFVEVGTASGVTAAIIADARPNLSVLCIDSFVDHDAAHMVGNEPCRVDHWRRNKRPNMTLWLGGFGDFVTTWLGTAVKASAVLVDAGHAEPDCWYDLHTAVRMLAPGGTIFAHDCDCPEPELVGVTRAVERFCSEAGFEGVEQHWTLRALRRCRE